MQAWEEKLLERQKEKRELLRKMNHKMSIEKIADVLDMDVSEVKHIIEEQYDTEENTSVLEDVMLWITDLKGAADDEGNDKKI